MESRYYWIDWMKVIGMFLIIWGHFFPIYSNDIIYSFNVPLFFFISGYLGGGKNTLKLHPLLIPYVAICATYLVLDIPWQYKSGDLTLSNYINSIGYMILGFQRTPHGVSASAMWFVYTLALCKIIHYIAKKELNRIVLGIICLILTYLTKELRLFWSYQNVFICYPFYMIGSLMFSQCKVYIDQVVYLALYKVKNFLIIAISIILLLIILAPYNGFVMMYQCGYGENIFLFLILSFLGIFAIFLFSILLENYRPRWLMVISQGNIVILAYHYLAIRFFYIICNIIDKNLLNNDILTFVLSIIVFVSFIPIIKIVSRYFPFIMGGRRI